MAFSAGIPNRSVTGCNSCHTGGAIPMVTIDGPASVVVGDTASYTLTVVGGAGAVCGLDVSATLGTLAAVDSGTRLLVGEVTHDGPRDFVGGSCSFAFDWTAPDVTGSPTASLRGAGNSANGTGTQDGDGGATTSFAVNVTGGASASISASDSLVPVGAEVTLTWSASNADDCEAFGAWSGTKAVGTGLTEIVMPAEGSNVYGLDCDGNVGTATATTQTVVTGVTSFPSFPIDVVQQGLTVQSLRIAVGGENSLFTNVVVDSPSATGGGGTVSSAVGNLIFPPTDSLLRSIEPDGSVADLRVIDSSGFPIDATANGDVYRMDTEQVGFSTHSHIDRLEPDGTFTRITSTLADQRLLPFSAGEYTAEDDGTIYWVVLSYAGATREGRTILRIAPDGVADVVLDTSDGLSSPADVAVDADGGIYCAESFFDRLVYRDPMGQSSFLLTSAGDGNESLLKPVSVTVDAFGNAFVAGEDSDNVFKVTPAGAVSVALSSTQVGSGVFNGPIDLEADAHGNVYVLAENSRTAWRIRADGEREFLIDASGDGTTSLGTPIDLAVDDLGNVFVSDRSEIFRIQTPIPEPAALLQALAAVSVLAGLRLRGRSGSRCAATRSR
jgi:hypothetical protein